MEPIDYLRFRLSSGREFPANGWLLSVDPKTGEIFNGYDSSTPEANAIHEGDYPDLEDRFSVEERREIADYMIAAWTRYRDMIR